MGLNFEKCYFCDEESLYNQPYNTDVISVCKKHFSVSLVS